MLITKGGLKLLVRCSNPKSKKGRKKISKGERRKVVHQIRYHEPAACGCEGIPKVPRLRKWIQKKMIHGGGSPQREKEE